MLFPLFLRLAGKDVLVVGGGEVAARKLVELMLAGARVRVVAKKASDAMRAATAASTVGLEERPFVESDIGDAWLVIAATSDPEVQREVCALAEARRIFAIAIDDPPNGSAYSASIVRRPPITIAISSDGEAPALTRLLREIVEQLLPDLEWVEAAKALRDKWKSEKTPMASRFPELVRAFAARANDLRSS
jgi:uroporphyrin-III C-methyltransferase/precorrin-2 dehydrogenase/sirohydrochlorin ferrochelatase